jgi:hypothetical protein
MADPNDPNSTGGNWGGMFGAAQNDPWSNLMLFGASMAAAGSQPGATFAGSVGKGFLGGYQASQNAAANQSEIGLRRAQTQNVGIEARQKNIGLNMQIQQMNFMRSKYGLPPLDQNGQPIDSTSSTQNTGGPSNGGLPVGQPSSGSAGLSKVAPQFTAVPTSSGQDASVGSSPIAAMAPSAQPSPNAALAGQPRPNLPTAAAQSPQSAVAAAQPPQPQPGTTPGPFEIPQEVWVGTMAPTKRQAGVMSGVYGMMGDQNNANFYRDYALKAPEGFHTTQNFQTAPDVGGPASMPYIQQKESTAAWAKVPANVAEAWGKPLETRPGNVVLKNGVPVYQNPVGIERYDPVSQRTYTDYVQPGMSAGAVGTPIGGGGGAGVVAPAARPPVPMAFRGAVAPGAPAPVAPGPMADVGRHRARGRSAGPALARRKRLRRAAQSWASLQRISMSKRPPHAKPTFYLTRCGRNPTRGQWANSPMSKMMRLPMLTASQKHSGLIHQRTVVAALRTSMTALLISRGL